MPDFDLSDYRSLEDDETIQEGDVSKDLELGEYCLISGDSLGGFALGFKVRHVRGKWCGFDDILRKRREK